MIKRKFVRSYPADWSVDRISQFMDACYRIGRIPKGAKVSSKKKRGGLIQVTWTWRA
jgi:hypothetical protein